MIKVRTRPSTPPATAHAPAPVPAPAPAGRCPAVDAMMSLKLPKPAPDGGWHVRNSKKKPKTLILSVVEAGNYPSPQVQQPPRHARVRPSCVRHSD